MKCTELLSPEACFTSAIALAFGTPGFLSVLTIHSFGIVPVPNAEGSSGGPSNSA